jgi:predicted metal-binding membrane protein
MTDTARDRWRVRAPLWAVSAAALVWMAAGVWNASGSHSHDHQTTGAMPEEWALLMGAMMAPLLRAPTSHVRDRSFSHRRVRAITLFLSGYAVVWMTVGLAVQLGLGQVLTANAYVLTAAVVVWQFSPIKQLCLNRRHGHPVLAAFGWAADRDTLRFGASHGVWCMGSCWLLMIWPMLFTAWWHIIAMMAVTLMMAAEQLESPISPTWSVRGPSCGARMVLAQARIWSGSL